MKKCTYCAEEIQDEAIKCRYCGEVQGKPKKPSIWKRHYNSTPFFIILGILILVSRIGDKVNDNNGSHGQPMVMGSQSSESLEELKQEAARLDQEARKEAMARYKCIDKYTAVRFAGGGWGFLRDDVIYNLGGWRIDQKIGENKYLIRLVSGDYPDMVRYSTAYVQGKIERPAYEYPGMIFTHVAPVIGHNFTYETIDGREMSVPRLIVIPEIPSNLPDC